MDKKYLVRMEKNGGVIFNLNNFNRIEINEDIAIFLKSLEYTGSVEKAKEILINMKQLTINEVVLKELEPVINDKVNNNRNLPFLDALNKIKDNLYRLENSNRLFSPLEVSIYPDTKCNLDCKFCFLNDRSNNYGIKKADYWNDLITIFDDMDVLSLSILGGEPTLYPWIDEVLEHAGKKGILTVITTNGKNIKDSTFNIIAKYKNITPVFSIQSMNQLNKELMGIDYGDSLSNLKWFLEVGKKVRINSVYTDQELSDFIELLNFSNDYKIDRYSIAFYVDNNKKNMIKRKRNILDLRKLQEDLDEYSGKHNISVNYSVEGCMFFCAFPEIEDEMIYLTDFDKKYYGCRAGKSKIEIYKDGSMLPCIFFDNVSLNYPKVNSENFIDLWDNYFISEYINKTINTEICKSCGFFDICNGGCPAERIKKYNNEYRNNCICKKQEV